MFFVPYVLFQPPMTIIIRKVGPTLFLGTIIMTWAAIMIVRCHHYQYTTVKLKVNPLTPFRVQDS